MKYPIKQKNIYVCSSVKQFKAIYRFQAILAKCPSLNILEAVK